MIGTFEEARSSRQTSSPDPSGSIQVEQDEVGPDRAPAREPVGDRVGHLRAEAVLLERLRERRRDRLLVLDQQDRPFLVRHERNMPFCAENGAGGAPWEKAPPLFVDP